MNVIGISKINKKRSFSHQKQFKKKSNPVLAPEERFWRPFFVRPKKIILIKRRGKSMKQKWLEMVQVTVLFQTDDFIFVWPFKNGNGRQNRSSGAKIGLLRRAGAKT